MPKVSDAANMLPSAWIVIRCSFRWQLLCLPRLDSPIASSASCRVDRTAPSPTGQGATGLGLRGDAAAPLRVTLRASGISRPCSLKPLRVAPQRAKVARNPLRRGLTRPLRSWGISWAASRSAGRTCQRRA